MRTRPTYRPYARQRWRPADLDDPYIELLISVLAGDVRVVRDGQIILHTDTRSEVVTAPMSVLAQLGLVKIGLGGVLQLTAEAYDEMFPPVGVVR